VTFTQTPIVIVVPNDSILGGENCAVTPMITRTTTEGFEVRLRSLDSATGTAGFYWMAVSTESDTPTPTMPNISFGSQSALDFGVAGQPGGWNTITLSIANFNAVGSRAFVTANNDGVPHNRFYIVFD
jgi:hypothetical protein